MKDKKQQLDAMIQEHQQQDSGVTPPADLWAGIESRLEERPVQQTVTPVAKKWWFAGGLSAVAASLMTVAVIVGLQSPVTKLPDVSEWYLLAQQMDQAQHQQVDAMASGYQLAGYEMTQNNYIESLASLRNAKQQLLLSMQENGGDAQMIDMLRWINEQEIQLLKHAYQQQPVLEEI